MFAKDITKIFSAMLAEIVQSRTENKQLQKDNKRLKEALRMCIPFTACSNKANNVCEFCYEKEHKPDCEYIKLTEEQT